MIEKEKPTINYELINWPTYNDLILKREDVQHYQYKKSIKTMLKQKSVINRSETNVTFDGNFESANIYQVRLK